MCKGESGRPAFFHYATPLLFTLTTSVAVVIMSNMKAKLLLHERRLLSEDAFVELIVWRLPTPKPGSRHHYKYRLAFITGNRCVLRYDNETGKGDHKHLAGKELPYHFTTAEALLNDFWNEVDNWRD